MMLETELTENPTSMRRNLLTEDICDFDVHLPNEIILSLKIHPKDTLSDLHQKLNNRLRKYKKDKDAEIDEIPPPSFTNSPTAICTQIHDIFMCNQESSGIVSIPFDKSIVISDFIENHKEYFENSQKYTIYLVDQEYYGKLKERRLAKKSVFNYLSTLITSYMV